MQYEAFVSEEAVNNDEWRVEALNEEGECFIAIFSGPQAQARAEEYAAWKNAEACVGAH